MSTEFSKVAVSADTVWLSGPNLKMLTADFKPDINYHWEYIHIEKKLASMNVICLYSSKPGQNWDWWPSASQLKHLIGSPSFTSPTSVTDLHRTIVVVSSMHLHTAVAEWETIGDSLIRCSWIMHLQPKRGILGIADKYKAVPPNGYI